MQTLHSLQQLLNLQQQYQQQQQQQLTLLQQPLLAAEQSSDQSAIDLVTEDQDTLSASDQNILEQDQLGQHHQLGQGQGQGEELLGGQQLDQQTEPSLQSDSQLAQAGQLAQQLQQLLEESQAQMKEDSHHNNDHKNKDKNHDTEKNQEKDTLGDMRSLFSSSCTSPILGLFSGSGSNQMNLSSHSLSCVPHFTLTSPLTVPGSLSTIGNTHNILSTLTLPTNMSSTISPSTTVANPVSQHTTGVTTSDSNMHGSSTSPIQILSSNSTSPMQILNNHSTSPVQAVVQQILDLNNQSVGALNLGNGSQSNAFSQITDFTSALPSNVNITLLQPTAISASAASHENSADISLLSEQNLAQLLNTSTINYVLIDPSQTTDDTNTPSAIETPSSDMESLSTDQSISHPPDVTTTSNTTGGSLVDTPPQNIDGESHAETTVDQSRNESPSLPVDILQLLSQHGFNVIKTG